jgi:WD40 repeat protein
MLELSESYDKMTKVQVTRLQSLAGHRDCVYTLQSAGVPSLFFSGAGDGMVVKWDLMKPENGEVIAKLPNSVYALHVPEQSELLIAGHNYEGIHFLDWKNKTEIGSLQLTKAAIFDIQSYNDFIFVATGDGALVKIKTKQVAIVKEVRHSQKSARTLAVNGKTGEVAVGYSDNFIRVFDLDTLALKYEWQSHANSVFTVRYSPDYKFLFSGSRDARLKVWDATVAYTQAAEVVAHLYAINHLEFSPDGKHFVTCSMDKSIKLWNTEELKLLKVIDKARHAGHGTSVNKLLWTPYFNQLVSASDDRTISVWNFNFEHQLL